MLIDNEWHEWPVVDIRQRVFLMSGHGRSACLSQHGHKNGNASHTNSGPTLRCLSGTIGVKAGGPNSKLGDLAMLFQDKTKTVVQQMYARARAKATTARKEAALKRLNFYHDDQSNYIMAALKEHFADPSKLSPCFINVVKKVINNTAQTYIAPPRRVIEGTDQDQEIFTEIANTTGLNLKLKTTSRYTKLLKTVMLRPVWRKGKMDLDILTGDILDVRKGQTPEELLSVMITHNPDSGKFEDLTYSLWTIEEIKTLDYRGNVINTEPNPYGVLPFIPIWDYSPPSGDFWLSGGNDLVVIQEAINEKLTDLLYVCRMQGFSVPYIKTTGLDSAPSMIGPSKLVELPPNGEFGFASPDSPIEDIVDTIEFLIQQAAISNGLSAHTVTSKALTESGISKLVSNKELEELRRDDIALFRQYEHQLFDMFRVVWNRHNTRTISDSATLSIDFADPKPSISPDKQADTWEKQLDLGVISRVDIAMERNPDLKTREDALAFLLQLQEEQRQLLETQI